MTYIDYLNSFNRWLEHNHLPLPAQVLYFRLLDLFNRSGWAEWVSVDNLRMLCMVQSESKHTLLRARDALIEAGFLEYKRGKKNTPGKYKLGIGCIKCTENGTVSGTKNGTENGTHNKTKNKTKIPPYNSPQGGSAPKYKPEWFERFYKLYPRHTARQAAVKAWDKLKPDFQLCKVMEAALLAQMQSAQWQDRDCIPHPSTWLNGARWTDEVPDAAQKTGEQHSASRKYHLEMIDGEEVVVYDD